MNVAASNAVVPNLCDLSAYYIILLMSNPNRLTTRDVARICRVSDATVKRWAVGGLIKSEKTNGGHRRFRPEDVAAFQSELGLGLGHCAGDNSLVMASKRSRLGKNNNYSEFLRSLICGCEEEVADLLIKRYLEGESLESIFDNVVAKELKNVGRLWAKGEISVAEEHLASACVSYGLFKLRTVFTAAEQNQRIAICCGLEGDYHGLPTDLARLVFESLGWSVINFGPNTPFFSLLSAIEDNRPHTICISGSIISDVERLTMDFERLTESIDMSKSRIIMGGRAFRDPDIRKRFPADFYPDTFQDLAAFIRKI